MTSSVARPPSARGGGGGGSSTPAAAGRSMGAVVGSGGATALFLAQTTCSERAGLVDARAVPPASRASAAAGQPLGRRCRRRCRRCPLAANQLHSATFRVLLASYSRYLGALLELTDATEKLGRGDGVIDNRRYEERDVSATRPWRSQTKHLTFLDGYWFDGLLRLK